MNSGPWAEFPESDPSQWRAQARQELQGEDPFEKLRISKGSLVVDPYYDRTSRLADHKIGLAETSSPFLGARAWWNTALVVVQDAQKGNREAMAHLNAGADALCFDLRTPVSYEDLLNGIEIAHCPVFFSSEQLTLNTSEWMQLARSKNGNAVIGADFTNRSSNVASEKFLSDLRHFRSFGIRLDQSLSAEESLAKGLGEAVEVIERMDKQGHPPEATLQKVAFQLSCGTDLFHEIARVRALRTVWALVCKAYGLVESVPFIHALIPAFTKEALQPHATLLQGTSGALAAVLAGCSAITVMPEDVNNPLMSRMARNVSLLLREEAHLQRVSDPLAGSYYIENLTHQMAEQAWKLFIERV